MLATGVRHGIARRAVDSDCIGCFGATGLAQPMADCYGRDWPGADIQAKHCLGETALSVTDLRSPAKIEREAIFSLRKPPS